MDDQGLGSGPIEAVAPISGGTQNVMLRFERDGRRTSCGAARSTCGRAATT